MNGWDHLNKMYPVFSLAFDFLEKALFLSQAEEFLPKAETNCSFINPLRTFYLVLEISWKKRTNIMSTSHSEENITKNIIYSHSHDVLLKNTFQSTNLRRHSGTTGDSKTCRKDWWQDFFIYFFLMLFRNYYYCLWVSQVNDIPRELWPQNLLLTILSPRVTIVRRDIRIANPSCSNPDRPPVLLVVPKETHLHVGRDDPIQIYIISKELH